MSSIRLEIFSAMPAKKSHEILNEERRIATWIDSGLKKPNKSQKGLAEALGVHTTIIARLRQGKRSLLAQELRIVADYLESEPPMIPVQLKNLHVGNPIPIVGKIGSEISYDQSHQFAVHGGEETVPSLLIPEYEGLDAYALHVEDNAFDLGGIPRGAWIVFIPYWQARKRLFAGDIVVYRYLKMISKSRQRKTVAVYCIRRVIKTKTGYELVPETSAGKSKYRSFYLSLQQARYSEKQRSGIIGWVIHSAISFKNEPKKKPESEARSLRHKLFRRFRLS